MNVFFFIFFSFLIVNGLKIWIPNTDINNKLNWNINDVPKNCDNIYFEVENDIPTFWNLQDLILSGLSLPITGDIIFSRDTKVQFRDKEKCSTTRSVKYTRNKVKGWLDPDNWKSDKESESSWFPHSERVPCAGEHILFPPKQTYAIQLPTILLPVSSITFDIEEFRGDTWPEFLKTELGYEMFKGPDNIRSLPWRNDIGCFDKKKCTCGRSAYTIKDGVYKQVNSRIFEEAVCLYAMPKCKTSECYSPVIPEGHCCGICGAIIKIEDKTDDGLNIEKIRNQVELKLKEQNFEKILKTYVGRTIDGNVQIVIVAKDSDDTIKSHTFASTIRRKLLGDKNFHLKISSHVSGLSFSNYVFNSVSGSVFGTFLGAIVLFGSLFYIYVNLHKENLQKARGRNPFTFARFGNALHEAESEENLEIGIEPGTPQESPQAFDNPMYSGNIGISQKYLEIVEPSTTGKKSKEENNSKIQYKAEESVSEVTSTKEFSNLVFKEYEKPELLNIFEGEREEEKSVLSEIKL